MKKIACYINPSFKVHNNKANVTSVSSAGSDGGGFQIEKSYECYEKVKLRSIIRQLQYDYKSYKYTVYRCASKFVALQKILHTCNIPYKLILAVMERHGISDADAHLMMPPFQFTSLLYDIFHASEKLGHFHFSVDAATTKLADFFWDVYDPQRRFSISIIELKITFMLLSKSFTSNQCITEIYKIVSRTKSKCITKLNFEYMMNIFIKLCTYIGEGTAYGSHNLNLTIEQSFAKCNNSLGLTEQQFQCLWYSTQTLFSIYGSLMSLVKRMEDAEKLIHSNECASCHCTKIVGIRFRCHICKDLSLCLKCFATGNNSGKHAANHRFHEMYTEDTPSKSISHYLNKFCLRLFCLTNADEDTQEIIHTKDSTSPNETELITITISPSLTSSSTSHTNDVSQMTSLSPPSTAVLSLPLKATEENNVPPIVVIKDLQNVDERLSGLTATACNAFNVSERLQNIIDKLLIQNRKLEQQLKCVRTSTPAEISEFLDAHQKFLLDVINEMRSFTNTPPYPLSTSTPHRLMVPIKPNDFDNFSVVLKNEPISNRLSFGSNNKERLSLSIYGADINRSYLDANKSNYSLNDLSLWFNRARLSSMPPRLINTNNNKNLSIVHEVSLTAANNTDAIVSDTDMTNFKLLLNKVKEIVEDSYSDNTELSEATQNLENVVDAIIKSEETRRRL